MGNVIRERQEGHSKQRFGKLYDYSGKSGQGDRGTAWELNVNSPWRELLFSVQRTYLG